MSKRKHQFNTETQFYRGIPLLLIERYDYHTKKAKRFTMNGTNQNVWIPNQYLLEDGTINPEANLDFVFFNRLNQIKLSGLVLINGIYQQIQKEASS